MTVINESFLVATFEEENTIFLLMWNGFVKSENFRNSILRMVEFIKRNVAQYPHIKILADVRKLDIVKMEDTEWMAREIDPILYEHGVRKSAFILPESIFTQMSIKNFNDHVSKNQNKLQSMNFPSEQEARAWLSAE